MISTLAAQDLSVGTMRPGQLDVLNVNAGDMKFSFDSEDPQEVARAARVVTDMLKRGYLIFVEGADGKLVRATGFDPKTNEYIIADGPGWAAPFSETTAAVPEKSAESLVESPVEPPAEKPAEKPAGKGKGKGKVRVPAADVKATAVAPTGGG